MSEQISRKQFLSATTKSVVAVSACAATVSAIAAHAQTGPAGVVSNAAAPPWPWPYTALDPEDIRKQAHKFYYDGGCCYGAFHAIVTALSEKVGAPYTNVPTQMMYYGGGGAAGWGTLCGALNGAAAAISIVVDRANANVMIGELFGWSTKAQFPSDVSNNLAVQKAFLVNRIDRALKQTVPNSVLCHASVSTWCSQAGANSGSADRAERCARLTGDIAAKTVEMLNDFAAKNFKASYAASQNVTFCQGCHGPTGHIGNVQSGVKMECTMCHRPFDHLY